MGSKACALFDFRRYAPQVAQTHKRLAGRTILQGARQGKIELQKSANAPRDLREQ
jgi:hypothetical protein